MNEHLLLIFLQLHYSANWMCNLNRILRGRKRKLLEIVEIKLNFPFCINGRKNQRENQIFVLEFLWFFVNFFFGKRYNSELNQLTENLVRSDKLIRRTLCYYDEKVGKVHTQFGCLIISQNRMGCRSEWNIQKIWQREKYIVHQTYL